MLAAALDYFRGPEYAKRKVGLEHVAETIKTLLDYPHFNFSESSWQQFYGMPALGRIIRTFRKSIAANLQKLRDGLQFLFSDTDHLETRLPAVMDRRGTFHVDGVGVNVLSKILAAHDAMIWPVYNHPVAATLKHFQYKGGHNKDSVTYLAYTDQMRKFKKDLQGCDFVALDSFFRYWYETHPNP